MTNLSNNVVNFNEYLNHSQPTNDEITLLKQQLENLTSSLEYEKQLRKSIEEQNKLLETQLTTTQFSTPQKNKNTIKNTEKEYSEFTAAGKPKAQAAESIRSYDDFTAMQQYFLDKSNIRDWMLWTIGVSLGLRISDLLKIKYKHFLKSDNTFRQRMKVLEQKTSKVNDCLITEAVVYAITIYLNSIDWKFDRDDYLFKSKKTKTRLKEEYGWKIISDAGKALKLPIHIGSHTMRKSFANIAACVDTTSVDMNAITKVQGLLNHSDQRVTMKYLGSFHNMFDKARMAVSDFVMGKTNINELVVGSNDHLFQHILAKFDSLETKLLNNSS